MRALLLISMFTIAALAGCADSTEPTPMDDVHSDHDHMDHDHNVTVNNTAPVASLTADLLNGTAPLLVNLTLDGFDAEGDNMTWSLTLNGTEMANSTANATLPFVQNATLEAGNHTFVFALSDGNLSHEVNLTISVAAAMDEVDPNAPVDMGWYVYDPVTQLCNVKSYDSYGTGPATVYVSTLSGGTWVIAEDNGVAGLQIANDHPTTGTGAGFEITAPDCKSGDLIVI